MFTVVQPTEIQSNCLESDYTSISKDAILHFYSSRIKLEDMNKFECSNVTLKSFYEYLPGQSQIG